MKDGLAGSSPVDIDCNASWVQGAWASSGLLETKSSSDRSLSRS
jgi:hypothetical protein